MDLRTFLYIIISLAPAVLSQSGRREWARTIDESDGLVGHVIFTFEPVELITIWHYRIELNYNSSEPQPLNLYIVPDTVPYLDVETSREPNICFNDIETFNLYYAHNPFFIHLVNSSPWPCALIRNDRLLCEGDIPYASAIPATWYGVVAYDCPTTDRPFLDLQYNISVEWQNNVTCYDISTALDQPSEVPVSETLRDTLNECSTFYTSYSRFNFYSFNQNDINWIGNFFTNLPECYQHKEEMLCRVVLPECGPSGNIIHNCIEGCHDLREGCKDVPIVSETWIKGCHSLAHRSEGTCAYKEISCEDAIQPPENGYVNMSSTAVNATAQILCNPGYREYSNASAVCNYNGDWDMHGTQVCIAVPTTRSTMSLLSTTTVMPGDIAETVPSSTLLTTPYLSTRASDAHSQHPNSGTNNKNQDERVAKEVIIIASVMCLCFIALLFLAIFVVIFYRYEVIILAFKSCRRCLFCKRFIGICENKTYHAFIAFNDANRDYVQRQLQERLDDEGFRLFVDYRDGKPNELPMRYIPEAIAKSHSVIIVLNQTFLDDNMCQFMLDQVFYQSLEGDKIKIIILYSNDYKRLENMPRYLKTFISQRCIKIDIGDAILLDKLRYELHNYTFALPRVQYVVNGGNLNDRQVPIPNTPIDMDDVGYIVITD